VFSASHNMVLDKPKKGFICPSDGIFLGFMGRASIHVENFAIIGYFEEIRDIIRKKHAHFASLQGTFFWVRV
jgi:hypothetical protein